MSDLKHIAQYYDSHAIAEDKRLTIDSVEYNMTYSTICNLLTSNSTILDMGGGTGVYSLPLAAIGHRVTLVDISDAELALAQQKSQEQCISLKISKGDAISYADNCSYNGVLCLGPLYHCSSEKEIIHIIESMLAHLSADGYLFCSFVSIFAKFNRFINEMNNCSKTYNLNEINDFWANRVSTKNIFSFEEHHGLPISLVNPLLLRSFLYKNGFQVKDLFALDIVNEFPQAQFSDDYYRFFHQLGESDLITHGEHIMVVLKKIGQ